MTCVDTMEALTILQRDASQLLIQWTPFGIVTNILLIPLTLMYIECDATVSRVGRRQCHIIMATASDSDASRTLVMLASIWWSCNQGVHFGELKCYLTHRALRVDGRIFWRPCLKIDDLVVMRLPQGSTTCQQLLEAFKKKNMNGSRNIHFLYIIKKIEFLVRRIRRISYIKINYITQNYD